MQRSNSKEALNLYAKVEDLLDIKEYAKKLYSYYYPLLDRLEFNSLLDIGCGRGEFLEEVKGRYNFNTLKGVDKSDYMASLAKKRNLDVISGSIKDIKESFDIATATFDMVNYLTPFEFIEFFKDLKRVVKSGGYFIFDVNSEFGLSDLAVGNFIAEDGSRFLAIESFYEGGVYDSTFTLFERDKNCYKKFSESISQYYYSKEFFELLDGWKLEEELPIKLYDMEMPDKVIYILKREDETK